MPSRYIYILWSANMYQRKNKPAGGPVELKLRLCLYFCIRNFLADMSMKKVEAPMSWEGVLQNVWWMKWMFRIGFLLFKKTKTKNDVKLILQGIGGHTATPPPHCRRQSMDKDVLRSQKQPSEGGNRATNINLSAIERSLWAERWSLHFDLVYSFPLEVCFSSSVKIRTASKLTIQI